MTDVIPSFEALVDAEFKKQYLECLNRMHFPAIHAMSTCELYGYGLLVKLPEIQNEQQFRQWQMALIHNNDHMHYVLQKMLELGHGLGKKKEAPRSMKDAILATTQLIGLCEAYDNLRCELYGHYQHLQDSSTVEGNTITFVMPELQLRYRMAERIFEFEAEGWTPMMLIIAYLNGSRPATREILQVVQMGRLKNNQVPVHYDLQVLKRLHETHELVRHYPLQDWTFPWGSYAASLQLSDAIGMVVLYHILSIFSGYHKASKPYSIRQNYAIRMTKPQWVNALSSITGLPNTTVRAFVEHLTYGQGVKTPDPALQYFIPVDHHLQVPAFALSTSNPERNLLALHARVDKDSFDQQSHMFEGLMSKRLSAAFTEAAMAHRMSFHIPGDPKVGDLDVLLIDPKNQVLVVCELKWMLPPGDPSEVINKVKVCRHAIQQTQRKAKSLERHLDGVLHHLGLPVEDGWRVERVVVLDGFSGSPAATETDYPVILLEALLDVLKVVSEPARLAQVVREHLWLPQPQDYVHELWEHQIGPFKIKGSGFGLKTMGHFRETLKVRLMQEQSS